MTAIQTYNKLKNYIETKMKEWKSLENTISYIHNDKDDIYREAKKVLEKMDYFFRDSKVDLWSILNEEEVLVELKKAFSILDKEFKKVSDKMTDDDFYAFKDLQAEFKEIIKPMEKLMNKKPLADLRKGSDELFKSVFEIAKELYDFADSVLVVYDPIKINWKNSEFYSYYGLKDFEKFLNYTFELLENNKNRFDQNLDSNLWYQKVSDYISKIG